MNYMYVLAYISFNPLNAAGLIYFYKNVSDFLIEHSDMRCEFFWIKLIAHSSINFYIMRRSAGNIYKIYKINLFLVFTFLRSSELSLCTKTTPIKIVCICKFSYLLCDNKHIVYTFLLFFFIFIRSRLTFCTHFNIIWLDIYKSHFFKIILFCLL